VNKNEPLAQKKNLNLLMLILAITYQPVKRPGRASLPICQISLILALKMPFLFDETPKFCHLTTGCPQFFNSPLERGGAAAATGCVKIPAFN